MQNKCSSFVIAHLSGDNDRRGGGGGVNQQSTCLVSGFLVHIFWFDWHAISACCCFENVSVFVHILIEQAYQTIAESFDMGSGLHRVAPKPMCGSTLKPVWGRVLILQHSTPCIVVLLARPSPSARRKHSNTSRRAVVHNKLLASMQVCLIVVCFFSITVSHHGSILCSQVCLIVVCLSLITVSHHGSILCSQT